jgi:hypothetical protein
MRICFFWLGLAAAALCLTASSVHAQQWLSDRSRAEGHGIRMGELELHPGIGTEIGYDSNVFLSEDPQDSAILRVAPSLYLSTLSAERLEGEEPTLAFRAGMNGTLKHYFATQRGTDMGVGEDAKLQWNASSIFALQLFQDYRRTIDPFGEVGGPSISSAEFDRDLLGGGIRLQLSTRGRLLKGGVGYRIDWDNFEGDGYDPNDSLQHTISADTSWEFLPKTAIFWNGSFMLHDYVHDSADDAIGQRNGSEGITNKLGLNGALTARLSFTLAGGYSARFFDNNVDSETVTAQVEARWRFLEQSTWSLGYDRTMLPSFQGNSMRTDRIKTGLQSLLGGVVAVGAKAEVAFVQFGDDPELAIKDMDINPNGSRHDIQLLLNLNGEYRLVDWFALTAEVGYLRNISKGANDRDFFVRTTLNGVTDDNYAKYQRFEAWFGVRAFL